MNETLCQAFLDLISLSLRKEELAPVDLSQFQNIDWYAVYILAIKHQIHTILYPTVKKLAEEILNIPQQLLLEWRRVVYLTVSCECNLLEQFKDVISEFNRHNIPLVLFKGAELRQYYPFPELRIMGDIDILIPKDQIQECEEIIEGFGYYQRNRYLNVVEYEHNSRKCFDLHSAIINKKSDSKLQFLNEIAWKNTINGEYCGEKVLIFTPAFNLAYLMNHMYKHFIRAGVGIRQLCDITLYINKYDGKINWDSFWAIIQKTDIVEFTTYVLYGCTYYLDSNLSWNKYVMQIKIKHQYMETFMRELVSGGVFGGDNFKKRCENHGIDEVALDMPSNRFNRLYLFFKLLFSSIFVKTDKLEKKYKYVQKKIYLLPIHRLFYLLIKRSSKKAFVRFLFLQNLVAYLKSIGRCK